MVKTESMQLPARIPIPSSIFDCLDWRPNSSLITRMENEKKGKMLATGAPRWWDKTIKCEQKVQIIKYNRLIRTTVTR